MKTAEQFSKRFAAALKARRLEVGLSHERLAKKSGVSRSAISMIEGGQRSASLITCFALAKALGVTVSDMAKVAEGAQV